MVVFHALLKGEACLLIGWRVYGSVALGVNIVYIGASADKIIVDVFLNSNTARCGL
jgi:hypothetical protein